MNTGVKERMVTGSLAEQLTERAAKQPGQLGYRYFSGATGVEVCITYGELDARARRIALALRREGVANIRSGPTLLKSQPAGRASTSLTPVKPALITSTKIGLTCVREA
ncbi:MAG TPA: hypothetical protein VF207_03635 [Chthoniobacterales bacterium]